jgi:hypothetical protein
MPSNTGRSTIRLPALILLALLVDGCGGDSASPTAAPTTATTVAPTTTSIPLLGAKEVAWLKGVSAVRTRVEKSSQAPRSGRVTRAIFVESGKELAGWSRQLRRLGAPSHLLQPVYTPIRKVIRTFDKGANCYARAAGVVRADGAVEAGTPEERIASEAVDCGQAAKENGTNLLYEADDTGRQIRADYG